MPTLPSNRFQLKQLHQEIDLFDRKLAHLLKYEEFASDADRKTAADKMAAKRQLLVRNALQMVSEGITFEISELPRSFREEAPAEDGAAVSTVGAEQAESVGVAGKPVSAEPPSPYAGTSLDFRTELEKYKKNKKQA